MNLVGCCARCGQEDTGSDDWASFDIGIEPGNRGARHTELTRTELRGYLVCETCLASPWGAALRTILEHPSQRHVVEYTRCTVLCTHQPHRKRRVVSHALGRTPTVTCPSCWDVADVEHLDAEPTPGRLARWLLRKLPEIRPAN